MTRDPNPRPVQKTARWARIAWCSILGAAGALEVYGIAAKTRDDTLSETTRWLWRTDTKTGRSAFWLFWALFSAWFLPHIVKVTRQENP